MAARAAGIVVFLFIAVVMHCATGAVFTVDLGSESIKVAVVNPRPGHSPIAIAINEISKRKSPALVAITDGDRLLSEEAAGIAARYPDRVVSRLRDIVGVPFSHVQQLMSSAYASFDLVPEAESAGNENVTLDRRPIRVRMGDGGGNTVVYSAEELLSMILLYAKHMAEAHAHTSVVDAVVSVPSFFSQSQRQAVMDAADLAGVNVMALVHEHTGVALQYGIDKDFSNGSQHVAIIDMGATTMTAAIVRYSAYGGKDKGKTVSSNQLQVKSVCWDASLGGQTFESRLVEHFADEFNRQLSTAGTQSQVVVDVRGSSKAMAKLRKAVKRTKEILSANTEAPISVEALLNDVDFRSSITRDAFEQLCADLWPRLLLPLQSALSEANVSVADLAAVELVGGSTRVPKVQSVLSQFLGPSKSLDRHLDADEALALGAALFAANLSDGFKLNRRIGMVDGLPFAVSYRVTPLPITASETPTSREGEGEGEGGVEENLFPPWKKMPIKIIRSLKEVQSDFTLSLLYDKSHPPPPFWPASTPIATYSVTGVQAGLQRYSSYNLSHPIKASLHFSLTRSGLVLVDKAELVVDFSEWVEVKVPIILNATAADANATANANATGSEAEASSTTAGDSTSSGTDGVGGSSGSQESTGGSGSGSGSGEEKKTGSSESETAEGGKESAAGGGGGGGGGSAKPKEEKEEEPKFETKLKLRKRTIRVPLEVADATHGFQRPMSSSEFTAARLRLEALERRDTEKRALAEAKNALEAYVYAMKDKLEAEDGVQKVTTVEQRDAFSSALNEAEDWLYMDGDIASIADLRSKLNTLKVTGDAFLFRLSEMERRPGVVADAISFIADSLATLESWRVDKPWLNSSDVDAAKEKLESTLNWLDSEAKAQALKPAHEDPVFTTESVGVKIDKLRSEISRLNRIAKPKVKISLDPKEKEENKTTESKAQDEGGSAGDVKDEL